MTRDEAFMDLYNAAVVMRERWRGNYHADEMVRSVMAVEKAVDAVEECLSDGGGDTKAR